MSNFQWFTVITIHASVFSSHFPRLALWVRLSENTAIYTHWTCATVPQSDNCPFSSSSNTLIYLWMTQRFYRATACNTTHCIVKAFLSVSLTNAWLWQKEKKLYPHSYTTWTTIHPSFLTKKNGWWEATPSTWNFGPNWSCWSENSDFQSIFACSTSAITP